MLEVTLHRRGDVTLLRCQGRLVAGVNPALLWSGVNPQGNIEKLVLDLARVDRIDAAGVGILLTLHGWARAKGIQLQLMNVTDRVLQILELTRLDGVFGILFPEEVSQQFPRLPQSVCAEGFPC